MQTRMWMLTVSVVPWLHQQYVSEFDISVSLWALAWQSLLDVSRGTAPGLVCSILYEFHFVSWEEYIQLEQLCQINLDTHVQLCLSLLDVFILICLCWQLRQRLISTACFQIICGYFMCVSLHGATIAHRWLSLSPLNNTHSNNNLSRTCPHASL